LKGFLIMKNKFTFALTLAVVLSLIAATFVLADNLFSDGDGLTPVVDQNLGLGANVCLGTSVTKPILHAVSRNGGYGSTNVFAKGVNVTVSIGTTSVNGSNSLSVTGGGTIAIPSNWDTVANNTLSPSVSSSITFVANTLGPITATVNYNASGPGSGGGTLTRSDSLSINGTVVNCDTTPPTLNLPADFDVEATSAFGAVVTYTASATDSNPASPAVDCSPISGSTFALGTTTVSCSSTDAVGNTANGSFKVTVKDTTPPTVTAPGDVTLEAVDGSGAVVTYGAATASDTVDGSLAATCIPASGYTFSLGSTTVTCSATDAHGNTGSSSFTVKIQDTTIPLLSLPTDLTEEATSASGASVSFVTSASDLVDGPVTVNCSKNSGDTFPLGDTTVSCSATDSSSNTANGSFKVTVVDTTAPSIDAHADVTEEATSAAGALVTYTAPATLDAVDGAGTATCTPTSGSQFALGTTPVNCSITDAHGNSANSSFDVTVQDTTSPDLTVPADQLLEATGPGGAQAFFTASATDIVDGSLVVSCSASSGATFPLGTTTVNCSVSDAAGNDASGSFIIKVVDTTDPTIDDNANLTLEATGPSGAVATFSNPAASDIVDTNVAVVCAPATGSTFALGTHAVTCTATDDSGNSAQSSFDVIVQDTTDPTIGDNANLTLEATGPSGAVATFSNPAASDIVDTNVAVVCAPATGSTFALGTHAVTCTATDDSGNSAQSSFDVTVQDTTDPTITLVSRLPAANSFGWNNSDVTVKWSCSDIVGVVSSTVMTTVSSEGSVLSAIGTCEDTSGNTASDTQTGIKIDKTAPTSIAFVGGPAAGSSYYFGSVPAAPTCSADGAISGLNSCVVSGYDTGVGSHTMTATATDKAGNVGTATRSYTVLGWTLQAFYQPVDMGNVWNTVKNGSTVPLKFEVFAGSTELTNVDAVDSLRAVQIACTSLPSAVEDAIETLSSSGSTVLRYDTTSGQFIFNWQTPRSSQLPKCYQVTLITDDGSRADAFFKLK
jgi:hypothetical protein